MANEIMIERRKAWVEALRSGEYKQEKYQMYNPISGGYCCLGVGYKLATNEIPPTVGSAGYFLVKDYYGLTDGLGKYGENCEKALFLHNDTDELNFNEIADIIESSPEGLFY